MELRLMDVGRFGDLSITSFVASRHPSESCGTNGLPLTPNSISILGEAQVLKTIRHRNLCSFLDCVRGKHERIVLVSEHFTHGTLYDVSIDRLLNTSRNILEALSYLNRRGIVNGNLNPSNVVFDSNGTPKLVHFGLNHLTSYGRFVAFPIGDPRHTAPEVFVEGRPVPSKQDPNDVIKDPEPPRFKPTIDIWSLGTTLLSILLLPRKESSLIRLWNGSTVSFIVRKVLSFLYDDDGKAVFEKIIRENQIISDVQPCLRHLIEICLHPDPKQRPEPKDLLADSRIFGDCEKESLVYSDNEKSSFPTMKLRSSELTWPPPSSISDNKDSALDVVTIEEAYYLWRLAGGDVFAELRKRGLMVTVPPILALPKVVLGEGHPIGALKERCTLYDPTVILLNFDQLRSCLSELTTEDFYVLINDTDKDDVIGETRNLPLIIKEKDVRYQFSRIILFRRLLQGYPFTRNLIWKEAKTDSLPLYRAQIWASLLNINYDVYAKYEEIDKESWTPTDRQIEVDIPRCHQYNSLLSSPEGHRKFKRVLKAWVVTNPQYVYWQGLDSLCAPFLYLNFNDEALAFACLTAFIPKYLYGMFQKDNSVVIQEYLAKFSHIQAFHDPILFNHLKGIGFIPDLYAIPWVLTMFAHVFPLHNIFHLWDKLLLGNSAFPLCVGLAILYQLRERLLLAEFNDCILLFSDLPAIDIEKCVKDSIQIFCTTPKSLTFRKYDTPTTTKTTVNPPPIIDDLKIDSVTLADIKRENVPRISGEELLILLGIRSGPEDGHKYSSTGSNRVILIDVRPYDEYKIGTLPGASSLPSGSSYFDDQGHLISNRDTDKLMNRKGGKIICVFGSRKTRDAHEFAEKLLNSNVNRVCVLHIGIEIFKIHNGNVLVVPNT